jgi:hypothetical protein
MKHSLAALMITLACFGCAPSGATQSPPAAAPVTAGLGAQQAAAMVGLYQKLCLQDFPDSATLTAALTALDASEMAAEEVTRYLHADPGRGWKLLVDGTAYVLTVENPPYHTCALRRMTPNGLADHAGYDQAVSAYAAAHRLAVRQLAKRVLPLSGGAELTAFSSVLAPAGATTARETSLLLLTDYHGRIDRAKWPETGDGPGVEVRMAHQIVKPFRIDTLQ